MMLYQLAIQLADYSRLEGANVRGRIMISSTGNQVSNDESTYCQRDR